MHTFHTHLSHLQCLELSSKLLISEIMPRIKQEVAYDENKHWAPPMSIQWATAKVCFFIRMM